MKREMDLVRKLVLAIEDSPHAFVGSLNVQGATEEQIGYHAYLLVDAGLAEGVDATDMESSGPEYQITHLTWAGHDFADACRNDDVWNKATRTISEKVGSVTFDVFKQVLVSFAKTAIGLG